MFPNIFWQPISSATGQSHCDTAAFAIDLLQALAWRLVYIEGQRQDTSTHWFPVLESRYIIKTTTAEHIFKRYIFCN